MAYGAMSYSDMKKQEEEAKRKAQERVNAGREVGRLNIPVEYKQQLVNGKFDANGDPVLGIDRKALNTITPVADNAYDGKGYGLTPNTLENTPSEQPKLGLTKAAQSAPINALQQGIVYQRGFTPNPADDIGNELKRRDSQGISFAPDTPIAQQPQLGLVNINARPSQAEIEQRQKLIKQALTPIAGARGITANQMRMAQSLMEEPQKRQAEIAKTQANINAGLQKAAMEAQQAREKQALDMARFGLQRQDALNAQARQDALQAKADERYAAEKAQNDTLFGLKKQGLEMQNEQARLGLNKLQQAEDAQNEYYNAQTPEEQEKAYNKMKRLGLVAKEDKGTFQKTKVPIMDENGTPIGEREIFYNPITVETRDPQGSGGLGLNPANRTVGNAAELADANGNVQLKRGQVVNGRRYLGGNPYDEKNWEEV
ncbi:MAG: hypothetical protein IKI11_04700 [Neisseriaceae bacterium]|nr:hypothetical protein [Neisseriaceae bacterium]